MTPYALIIIAFLIMDMITNLVFGLVLFVRWSSKNDKKTEVAEKDELIDSYDFSVNDPICVSEIARR